MDILKRLVTEEEGATMVEYGLMVALIAVVAMGAVSALGGGLNTQFEKIKDAIISGTVAP